MNAECAITQGLLARQRTMFRLAERDYGITHKIVHLETGMSLSAVGQYARGETAMSGPAICKLAAMRDFPAALLTLLIDGTGRVFSDEVEQCTGLRELGCEAAGFTADLMEAERDGKVSDIETARLKARARRVASIASKVAGA